MTPEQAHRAAESVLKLYTFRCHDLSKQASLGNLDAATEVLRELTNRNYALQGLGFAVGDSGELIPYVAPEYDPMRELARKAHDGDADAAKEYLSRLAEGL